MNLPPVLSFVASAFQKKQFLPFDFFFIDLPYTLFEAGCWLNGSKLQENEAKKKVPARILTFLCTDLFSISQQMRLLGGRALQ